MHFYFSHHNWFYVFHSSEICGIFDCIWDKHSFHVMPPTDRKKWASNLLVTLYSRLINRYAKLCQSLLKPQGKILLCAVIYNQSEMPGMVPCDQYVAFLSVMLYAGPPFSITTDIVKSAYGK